MEDKYSIDEILLAVNEIQNKKIKVNFKFDKVKQIKKNNSEIPTSTLKLIEEAEKIKS